MDGAHYHTPSLEPFEVVFQDIVDNPQMRNISSFRLELSCLETNTGAVCALARKALRHSLNVTDLAIPADFLEPSHPLFRVVSYLQLLKGWSTAPILARIRLQRLQVSMLGRLDMEESTTPCLLPHLKHLDLRDCEQFPMLLLQQLDLPNIRSLKVRNMVMNSKLIDKQLTSLVLTVPWLKLIKSFTLNEARVSEVTLLWTLGRLPLLIDSDLLHRRSPTGRLWHYCGSL
ncbi:hypothetical protein FRB95_007977 [Tulasnella sp. JGI-2019a]|nr:hypothetical protein FRB95_007977 [Tulasnella sp. JGI-2019a]